MIQKEQEEVILNSIIEELINQNLTTDVTHHLDTTTEAETIHTTGPKESTEVVKNMNKDIDETKFYRLIKINRHF